MKLIERIVMANILSKRSLDFEDLAEPFSNDSPLNQ